MTKWYREYNFLYFKNVALPNIDVFYGKIINERGSFTYGITCFNYKYEALYIVLNQKLKVLGEDISCITLLHEIIHAAYPKIGHGPKFKKETRRLILGGAYDELLG